MASLFPLGRSCRTAAQVHRPRMAARLVACCWCCLLVVLLCGEAWVVAQDAAGPVDRMRDLQTDAVTKNKADFGHWGALPERYSTWTNHSNRLIPLYTFGINLNELRAEGSLYRDEGKLKTLYGSLPTGTLNPQAEYFDQTDVYRLQQSAIAAGKRKIILMVFDGLDWDTTRAATIYRNHRVAYESGRGTGLAFQDYAGAETDFGFFVTSPHSEKAKFDVNAQVVVSGVSPTTGGYNPQLGGDAPWMKAPSRDYLIGLDRSEPHDVTDSASSATSMTSGIKTYNAAINVAPDGAQVEPIARQLQRDRDFAIGIVSSVPFSHATPAAAYANNVTRNDYQDISRDLLGLPSSAHRREALPGADVVLGGGWGETKKSNSGQGDNFVPGNPYVDEQDLADLESRGVVVARRTSGVAGRDALAAGVRQATAERRRLVGLFGVAGGHLPFQTADGRFNPTIDMKAGETYDAADVFENPTLAELATAALTVLEKDEQGFWLMVEAGDVDWANHANNLDNSIGAIFSGEAAFEAIVTWIETHGGWDEAALIVTADHGHYFVLTDPEPIAAAGNETAETDDGA